MTIDRRANHAEDMLYATQPDGIAGRLVVMMDIFLALVGALIILPTLIVLVDSFRLRRA